jgi:hypothetical protein
MKRILFCFLLVFPLFFSSISASAAPSVDARIAKLESEVATLRSEVEQLKTLQTQALYLKNCVAKEKSTNNLKVSLKLASCTVAYFKKSGTAQNNTKK